MAERKLITLPYKPFLYTVDQVALLVGESPDRFLDKYVFREGYDMGARHPRQLRARNIEPDWIVDSTWRINEDELKRWLKFIGLGWREQPRG